MAVRYYGVLLSGIEMFFDEQLLEDYLQKLERRERQFRLYAMVIRLSLEEYSFYYLSQKRPALHSIQRKFSHQMVDSWLVESQTNPAMALARIYYQDLCQESGQPTVGHDLEEWQNGFLQAIHQVVTVGSTQDYIAYMEKLFADFLVTKHWTDYLQTDARAKESDRQKLVSELNEEQMLKLTTGQMVAAEREGTSPNNLMAEKATTTSWVFREKVLSAEFNPNTVVGKIAETTKEKQKEAVAHLKTPRQRQDYQQVRTYFGDSLLDMSSVVALEKRLCQEIHANCRLHLTAGCFTDYQSDYRLKSLAEQRRINLDFYQANYSMCRRHIDRLKRALDSLLSPEMNENKAIAFSGVIRSREVWRANQLHDYKIFEKNWQEEPGDFVVDILLDGSGSQSERQEAVAMQGYIIAEALALCGIPCRVSAFNNFLEYTVIRRYRDYNDSPQANQAIFDYYGTGMNRDGLAIKWVTDFLIKRPESNKVMIVLSDGRPNDVKIMDQHGLGTIRKNYRGAPAIRDTASEVRKARLKGVSILGVFNGRNEDLATQQKIYGRDFAYIRQLDQFSRTVGAYLKRQLR